MIFEKRGKGFYIIISITALVLVSGYVFYKIKKHNFLDHQLQKVVRDKTHGIYNINYDSISVDEIGGDLYIKNIYIKGDTARQKEMISKQDTNASSVIFDVYVPLLKVVNFKTARALLSKQLECSQIIISNPQVYICLFPGVSKQTDNKQNQQELYRQLLGNFKLIKADSVSVVDCKVVASDFFTNEVKFTTFNTTVNLSQLAIDSTYNQDRTRTLFCKEIATSSQKIILGDKKNTAEIQHATFNTRSDVIEFSRIKYDAFKNDGFFKTELEGISLQGIEWLGPVENSDLVIDKAVVNKGDFETLWGDTKENTGTKKERKILTGWIKTFSLNNLKVKSGNYLSRNSNPKKKPLAIKNNSFSIRHINIDRSSAFNGKLVNQAKEIQLNNDAISVKSGDRLYEYKVSGVTLNTRMKTILIKSLQVIPQLNEADFVKKAHYQTDRFDVNIRNIKCTNVNAEKLVKGELSIGNVIATDNIIKAFRDLSYPIDSLSRQREQMTYPHQLMHKLELPLRINKFSLVKTNIEYKEKNNVSGNSGRVRFSNSTISLSNISTYKARQGEKLVVNFKTDFLDNIPVTGGFTFSSDQWQKGSFTATASVVTAIEGSMLNQLTEPMGLIKVEKGVINSVQFSMKGDTNTSKGSLVMPYEDLKISVLKKKGDEYKKKGAISILANLAVKNNNKQGSNMRTASVVVTRNKYRSFFNFIWMTIFQGLKDVVVLKL